MNAFETVIGYFSSKEKDELLNGGFKDAREIRIRCGEKPVSVFSEGEMEFGERYTQKTLKSLISRMLSHSLYAWEEELGQGYFTLPMGVRVGVSGKFSEDNQKSALLAPYSILIRLAHEIKGAAGFVTERLYTKMPDAQGAIVLSPPGCGKTTFLRDVARQFSNAGKNVCLIDEKSEIASVYEGQARLDVGKRTDVCEGLSKMNAAFKLIRSMAPDVIVMDEIGTREDASAIMEAGRMGVKVFASAHAKDVMDALKRPMIAEILSSGVFRFAVVLLRPVGSAPQVYEYLEGAWHLKSL